MGCGRVGPKLVEIQKSKPQIPKKEINISLGFKIDTNSGNTANPKISNSVAKDVRSLFNNFNTQAQKNTKAPALTTNPVEIQAKKPEKTEPPTKKVDMMS